MATKDNNIILKESPPFQKPLTSKIKDNLPNLYTKQNIKNDKLLKIKETLQKSKIQNKKAIISLNKNVYNNKQSTDFMSTSFSELIKSNPNYTIPKFFEVYQDLFYNIPKKGEKSHHSLIVQSQDYINNYVDPKDSIIEKLIEEVEKKEEEFNLKENPEPKEHIFYPNGTFLRTHGWNVEIVEGVPQGLPIWVMQEGMKREFKNYDVYKVVKKLSGFTNMSYDINKKELIGDKDYDIMETLHQNDLNYIPTGKDINEDNDLNVPPGPDRHIDVSLANILDYFAVDVTCLEGSNVDPLSLQTENYDPHYDVKDSCYLRFWTLAGEVTSRGLNPGETKRIYWRKDNPTFDMTDTTLGLNSNILQQQLSGENDGLFENTGYMRFDYQHPEGTPTEYKNTPPFNPATIDIEPKLSIYGTRMYQRFGFGDRRPADGSYKSTISDRLWEQVFDDPTNILYNHSKKWDSAKEADNVNGSDAGGLLGGKGGYINNIYLWWDGDAGISRYVANVGTKNSGMFNSARHYFVVLDKNYVKDPGYSVYYESPTSEERIKSSKKSTANQYWGGGGSDPLLEKAYAWNEGNRFPTTEGGYYLPYEHWEAYNLV